MDSESPNNSTTKKRRYTFNFNGLTDEELCKQKLPDHLADNLDILMVGFSPSLQSVFRGHHYACPGHHFWRCIHTSGLVPKQMNFEDDDKLLEHGIGFTHLVMRASRSANTVDKEEVEEGKIALTEKIQRYRPRIAVFVGKFAYDAFFHNTQFDYGKQAEFFPGTNVLIFVIPSATGLGSSYWPRVRDKLPLFVALRKLREYSRGELLVLNSEEVTFPVSEAIGAINRKAIEHRRAHRREAAALAASSLPKNVIQDGFGPKHSDSTSTHQQFPDSPVLIPTTVSPYMTLSPIKSLSPNMSSSMGMMLNSSCSINSPGSMMAYTSPVLPLSHMDDSSPITMTTRSSRSSDQASPLSLSLLAQQPTTELCQEGCITTSISPQADSKRKSKKKSLMSKSKKRDRSKRTRNTGASKIARGLPDETITSPDKCSISFPSSSFVQQDMLKNSLMPDHYQHSSIGDYNAQLGINYVNPSYGMVGSDQLASQSLPPNHENRVLMSLDDPQYINQTMMPPESQMMMISSNDPSTRGFYQNRLLQPQLYDDPSNQHEAGSLMISTPDMMHSGGNLQNDENDTAMPTFYNNNSMHVSSGDEIVFEWYGPNSSGTQSPVEVEIDKPPKLYFLSDYYSAPKPVPRIRKLIPARDL